MKHRSLAVPLLAAVFSLAAARPTLAVEAAVHPFCVQQLARVGEVQFEGEIDNGVPAKLCNERYKKAPIEIRDGYYAADVKGIYLLDSKGRKTNGKPPFFAYRFAGLHRNISVVEINEGIGGPGVFSAIAFVAGWPVSDTGSKADLGAQITLVGLYQGGNRCNGGIAEAKMTTPSTLTVSERLTPYDLLTYRSVRTIKRDKNRVFYEAVENEKIDPISPRILELEPYRDLDTAATSCIGTVTTEHDIDSGASKLVSVRLTGLVDKDPKWVARHKHQACFHKVVRASVSSFPKTLEPDDVKALSARFESDCLPPSTAAAPAAP